MRIRRYFYVVRATPLPSMLARADWALQDDPSAVGSRRIEIGGGWYPTPGHIHVDSDLNASHLEFRAAAWKLPFSNDWAEEILAVHVLEHVLPARQRDTLAEWFRVLAPGGVLRVHVPNSPQIMLAYLDGNVLLKWRASGALLGQYCGPSIEAPADITTRADHQVLFDSELLKSVLLEVGFCECTDVTEAVRDRHTEGWEGIVPHFSLAFVARKPQH